MGLPGSGAYGHRLLYEQPHSDLSILVVLVCLEFLIVLYYALRMSSNMNKIQS